MATRSATAKTAGSWLPALGRMIHSGRVLRHKGGDRSFGPFTPGPPGGIIVVRRRRLRAARGRSGGRAEAMRSVRRSRAAIVHLAVAVVTVAGLVSVAAPASAASNKQAPGGDSGPAVHHDTSPPLRDVTPTTEGDKKPKHEKNDKRDGALPPHPSTVTP